MAKAKGKAVVSMKEVEAQMQAFASGAKARINQPTGNTIGIRNSKFTYKQEVIGDVLVVIALEFTHINAWYDTKFDPDNPAPPACFAISNDGKEMVPHVTSPNQQHERCDGCPQNAWASAETGRGKACKNTYRIACMETSSDAEDAEIAILSLPPTSQRNWDKYITALDNKLNRPPFGVITEFTFDEDADYPVVIPKVHEVIDDPAMLAVIMARIEDIRTQLDEPFDVSGYEPPTRRQPKGKAKAKAKTRKGGKSKFS